MADTASLSCSVATLHEVLEIPHRCAQYRANPYLVMTTPHPPAAPWQRHFPFLLCPTKQLVAISLLDVVCITVAMLFSSPVFQGSPSQMLLWPLVPLFVNRVMEIGSFLLGKAWAMLSLLQIALALVAVGLYIWVIDCGPVLVQEQNSTPLLLPVSCSAQIVMATMLCFIEVLVFMLISFSTQAHRAMQISTLTCRAAVIDLEAGRCQGQESQSSDGGFLPQPPPAVGASAYHTVVQPAGGIMVATPDEAALLRCSMRRSAQAHADAIASAQLLLTPATDSLHPHPVAGGTMEAAPCGTYPAQAAASSLAAQAGRSDACRAGEGLDSFVVPHLSDSSGEREVALLWKRRLPHRASGSPVVAPRAE